MKKISPSKSLTVLFAAVLGLSVTGALHANFDSEITDSQKTEADADSTPKTSCSLGGASGGSCGCGY